MYKHIYILSNKGATKNYIKRVFNDGFSFTLDRNEALPFSVDDSKSLLKMTESFDFKFYEEAS